MITDRRHAVLPGDPRLTGLAVFLGFWTVIAICAATTSFIALGRSGFDQWLGIFGYMSAYFYTWAMVSIAIHWLARPRAGSGFRWYVQLPLHVLMLIVIATLMPFVLQPEEWRVWLYGDRAIAFHSLNAFVYTFILAGSMVFSYYRISISREKEAQRAHLREIELKHSLARSRMEALRAQINPHFLFNTLNSIASLVESESNREAYEIIERLAILLRNALDFTRGELVPLERELGFLDAYLAIENVRFGDRLRVSRSVPTDCLRHPVPALSLQPLLENVVKHVLPEATGPVTVEIDISRANGFLEISVSDDGPGIADDAEAGVGLGNVQSRMHYLFGNSSSLRTSRSAQGGTTVTLSFPEKLPLEGRTGPREKKSDRLEEASLRTVAP